MTDSINNAVVELIHSHRSVRAFAPDRPLSDALIRDLVAAGQRASTSMGVQPYSVIAVTDQAIKDEIATLCNDQAHVAQCGALLVYAADWSRIAWQIAAHDATLQVDPVFQLIDSTWDISLMAQNVALAAQSIGLGMCMIGAVLPCSDKIGELLGLGDRAIVLLAQAIGHPTEDTPQRPRLPQESMLHFNRYTSTADSPAQQSGLDEHEAAHAATPSRDPSDPMHAMPWSQQKALSLGSGIFTAAFANFRADLAAKLGVPEG